MFIVGARRAADPNTGVVTTAAASVCDVGPPSASPPHSTENIHNVPSAAVAANANLEGSVHNRSQQQIINGTPSEKAVAHLIAPIANANVKMTTKMKGILKGLRYISQIFDAKEQEMEIGFPTDVKHVAHIGWDGPSVHTPSWMNEFRSVPDHSSAPLATQPTTATQKENIAPKSASQDLQQLMEMQDRGEAPTIPSQVLPRRRQSSGGSPFDSPDFLRPPAGARHHSLNNGTAGTAHVIPSEPIRSSPSRDKSIDQIATPPAPDAPRSSRRQSTAPPAPLSVDSINDPSSVHHHHQESPPHVLESPSTSSAGAASPAGVRKQPRRRKTKGSRSGSDGGGQSTGKSARAAARAAAQRAATGASIDDQSSSITSDVESYSTTSTNSTAAIDQINHDHTTTSRTVSENINGGGDSMNVNAAPAGSAAAIANVNNIGRDHQLSKSTSGNYNSSSSVVVLTSTKSITGAEPPAVIEKEEAHILPPNYF